MIKNQTPTYYHDYLGIESLTSCQNPKSRELGNEAHDEMLFIIVHQAYELWFKQILHEMKFIKETLGGATLSDEQLAECNLKIERIHKIQGLLLNQIDVLETMTPMDFLEFRDLLVPASGFQSIQFREIEIGLGINDSQRPDTKQYNFMGRLRAEDQKHLMEVSKETSIFSLVEQWLERIPFLNEDDFNFWDSYQNSVSSMLNRDKKIILENATLSEEQKKLQLLNLETTKKTFEAIMDSEAHDRLKKEGKKKLSHNGVQAALFILLYRNEASMLQPFRFLQNLMTLDENFTTWRYRHAQLAKRMLGTKIGTGGSSGHKYLKATAERNQIFEDISNLTTFLLPKSERPKLPKKLKEKVNSYFSGN
ncbi:MAG: tryptophan 2,3-dioxygenase [Halobacteriovoraceae bacterium]|nr:tryptophan 2,3-dioxygenase [Halobacteriovoraceae bacterium]